MNASENLNESLGLCMLIYYWVKVSVLFVCFFFSFFLSPEFSHDLLGAYAFRFVCLINCMKLSAATSRFKIYYVRKLNWFYMLCAKGEIAGTIGGTVYIFRWRGTGFHIDISPLIVCLWKNRLFGYTCETARQQNIIHSFLKHNVVVQS